MLQRRISHEEVIERQEAALAELRSQAGQLQILTQTFNAAFKRKEEQTQGRIYDVAIRQEETPEGPDYERLAEQSQQIKCVALCKVGDVLF